MGKEEMNQMIKAGFLREKKKNPMYGLKSRKKEVSGKEVQKLIDEGKIIFKGYGYVIVKRSKKNRYNR